MKTIFTFFLSLFLAIAVETFGQDFIGTKARLIKEKGSDTETGTKTGIEKTITSSDIGIIKLNDQTDEFNFRIPLHTILTTSKSDSINSLNRNVIANFRAVFPISDLDFFTSGSETSLVVQGELDVNGQTQPTTVILSLQKSISQDVNYLDIHSYPVRVSFVIDIYPSEYSLDYETINFTRLITIEVMNGVVNRSNDNRNIR